MLAIIQHNFTGIDGLTVGQRPRPHLIAEGVLIAMETLPVVPSDWHKETNLHATAEQAAQLPRVIGIGGVGTVIAVGQHRDQQLLNQRVLVMHPQGSYQEVICNTNPDWLFPLPDTLSNEAAATLTAGPGTALVLANFIKQHPSDQIMMTGANSVIGLILCQLLGPAYPGLTPIVSPASQAYFHHILPDFPCYLANHVKTTTGRTLLVDIAGSPRLLQQLSATQHPAEIVSIALQSTELTVPFTFVHEDFDPLIYQHFIQDVTEQKLQLPIDRSFTFMDTQLAQHYAKDTHSRGRVLVDLRH